MMVVARHQSIVAGAEPDLDRNGVGAVQTASSKNPSTERNQSQREPSLAAKPTVPPIRQIPWLLAFDPSDFGAAPPPFPAWFVWSVRVMSVVFPHGLCATFRDVHRAFVRTRTFVDL